ncbi:MAG: efflux RND transporter periplasmic adaptor subunit [Lysobacterales bacterium]
MSFAPQRTRLEVVGTSRARRSVDLYPEADGEVVAVNIEAGQPIAAGDVLLELDQRDQRLLLDLAKVNLSDAQRLLNRYQGATDSGAVLPTTLDTAASAVSTAEIAFKQAEIALRRRSVIAPFAGFVGLTDVEQGDRIGPATLITTLDDRSELLVRFDVPESMTTLLEIDSPVEVSTFADSGRLVARIIDIGSRINPATRTLSVEASVDNADDRLRPGMSFSVMLQFTSGRFAAVPEVALRWGAEGAYVWRDAQGRAERIAASVVQRVEGQVLIEAKLRDTDLIVVEGVQRLRDGAAIVDPDLNNPDS